jgi:hypothetical protein
MKILFTILVSVLSLQAAHAGELYDQIGALGNQAFSAPSKSGKCYYVGRFVEVSKQIDKQTEEAISNHLMDADTAKLRKAQMANLNGLMSELEQACIQ